MATRKKATPPTDAPYEADTLYRVTLNRVVPDSPVGPLSPGKENELRGWVCNAISDAIAHAEPV